jgi:hypothetical protein
MKSNDTSNNSLLFFWSCETMPFIFVGASGQFWQMSGGVVARDDDSEGLESGNDRENRGGSG